MNKINDNYESVFIVTRLCNVSHTCAWGESMIAAIGLGKLACMIAAIGKLACMIAAIGKLA